MREKKYYALILYHTGCKNSLKAKPKTEYLYHFHDNRVAFSLQFAGLPLHETHRHCVDVHLVLVRTAARESDSYRKERRKEMFYLTTHSTHFIYGYMASHIWLRIILIVRKETSCRHSLHFYMHHPTDRITHTTAFVTPE